MIFMSDVLAQKEIDDLVALMTREYTQKYSDTIP